MKHITFIITLISLLTVPVLYAEENYGNEVLLDTIVVTATRSQIALDEAPASVSLITKEDIDKFKIASLEDAVKHEAGLWVNSSSSGSVVMRGLNGQDRTLIMLNGAPLNDGYSGSVHWKTIGIDNVEKIEIIRGGGSALYGGNAMGGVINIITKNPDKLEAGAHGGYGTDNTYRFGAHAGKRYGNFSIRASYEKETSDGYPMSLVSRSISSGTGTLAGGYGTFSRTGAAQWICGDKGDVNIDRSNVNLMISYHLDDNSSILFDFQRGENLKEYARPNTYLYDELGNPSFSGTVDIGSGQRATISEYNYLGSPYGMKDTVGALTYKDSFGQLNFTGKAGYKVTDTWYTSASSGSAYTYDNAPGKSTFYGTKTWSSDLQGDIALGSGHFLTTGISFRSDDFDLDSYNISFFRQKNSTIDKASVTKGNALFYALYVQDKWSITDRLTLFGGVRFDYWKAYDGVSGNIGSELYFKDMNDSAFSPKISAVWHILLDTYIRGSVGSSFRPPTIYELFSTTTMGGSYTYHSNPNLSPETIWTYDAGIDQYVFNQKLKLSATFFYTKAKDIIEAYQIGYDNYKENVGKANIKGAELGVIYRPFNFIDINLNYSHSDSEVKKNDRDTSTVGKKLTYYPDKTFNAGFDIKYKKITASLTGNYQGRIFKSAQNDDLDGVYGAYSKRWLWDTKFSYQPLDWMETSLSVNNLFDEDYFESDVGAGRTVFLEIKFKY